MQAKAIMYKELWEQPEVLKALRSSFSDVHDYRTELENADNVLILGMGSSLFAALAAVYVMKKSFETRFDVHSTIDVSLGLVDPKVYDLIIIISQSGESAEIRDLAPDMTDFKCRIWAVTNSPGSTLTSMACKTIHLNAGKEVSSATKSYLATLFVFYMLSTEPKTLDQLIAAVEKCLSTDRTMSALAKNELSKGNAFRSAYFLGLGPDSVTAREAALLMKEKPRISAEGLDASEFLHGSIEAVEPGKTIIFAILNGLGDEYLWGVIKKLLAIGAIVYILGDPQQWIYQDLTKQGAIGISLPYFPSLYGPLISVIPFQFLAYHTAIELGIDVDDFIYISKVIDSIPRHTASL